MKGTAFSKVTEALAFQKFTASVYNEKLFKGLTDFQFERAVGIAVHVLDTATGPSGMAAAGDPTSVAVDDSGHEPLMPVAAVVSILVTVGQSASSRGDRTRGH
jgi:hypothetical protein